MTTISTSTTLTTAYICSPDTTGTLVLQTGATPTTALTIDSSQNVGIGTSSPSRKLDVAGSQRLNSGSAGTFLEIIGASSNTSFLSQEASSELRFNQSDASSNSKITFYTNNGVERMRIDSSGSVGIGTNAPSYRLDVRNTANSSIACVTSGASSLAQIHALGTSGVQSYFWQASASYSTYHSLVAGNAGIYASTNLSYEVDAAGYQSWWTNSNERMRIDSSGNVGIAQNSPSYKLDVNGTLRSGVIYRDFTDNTEQYLIRGTSSTGYNPFISYLPSGGTATRGFRFGAWNNLGTETEWMRLWDGNLRIGTTGGSGRLYVKTENTSSGTWGVLVENSAGTLLFAALNNGQFYTGSGTYNLTTASAANVFISSDNGLLYRSTSSIKYKTNVQDATHGLAEVLQLRAVTYEGKSEADAGQTFGGLIAEEVHEAGLTEFVQYAEDGTPDALAYGNMVSLCIKAIQEQQAIIQSLTQRIETLEAK